MPLRTFINSKQTLNMKIKHGKYVHLKTIKYTVLFVSRKFHLRSSSSASYVVNANCGRWGILGAISHKKIL
jgi:hypothetical protein